MTTHTYETTNERIAKVLVLLDELIGWAEADAEHAAENDAAETALDDKARANTLRMARDLIADCER